MSGIATPESFPIRDPRDPKMEQGRIVNPPRMAEIGGLDSTNKWDKDFNTSSQGSSKNEMKVERPTGVKGARKSSEYDL